MHIFNVLLVSAEMKAAAAGATYKYLPICIRLHEKVIPLTFTVPSDEILILKKNGESARGYPSARFNLHSSY